MSRAVIVTWYWMVVLACDASDRDLARDSGPDAQVAPDEDAGLDVDDAGSADLARPDDLDATDYCEVIADAFCPFYLRCGRMAIDPAAPDPLAACLGSFLETCNARYEPRYAQLAEAGLLHLSAAGVERCAQHLATVECAWQVQDLDGPCGAMWIGTQAAGAPCGLDVESFTCGPGTTCRLDLSLCGTCVSVVPDGEACGGELACRAESQCVDGRCVARGRPGASCGAQAPCVLGATCSGGVCVGPNRAGLGDVCGPARCPYGSACVGGICEKAGAIGASCDAERPCEAAYCAEGRCAAPQPEGATCQLAIECASGRCSEGSCRALPGTCWD